MNDKKDDWWRKINHCENLCMYKINGELSPCDITKFWQSSTQRGRHTQLYIITSLKWIIQICSNYYCCVCKLLSTHPIQLPQYIDIAKKHVRSTDVTCWLTELLKIQCKTCGSAYMWFRTDGRALAYCMGNRNVVPVMCYSSPVSDSRPDSSPFVPDSVSDSDSKVHDSVSYSDSEPVTRWLGDESGTRPGNLGANALFKRISQFPLAEISSKFHQNFTWYFPI